MTTNYTEIHVVKQDGSKVPFDPDKIHNFLFKNLEGITGVSVSEAERMLDQQLFDGITTDQITEILIEDLAKLINEQTPNYEKAAANTRLSQLRKHVYGKYDPDHLYDVTVRNIERGMYTSELLEWYSKEDFDWMESIIDHKRDNTFTYIGITQVCNKYLVQDRVSGEKVETPQIMYMLLSATAFHKYEPTQRKFWIKTAYDLLSTFVISLPSPILAGLRTPEKQYSSCTLIESGDNLNSINRVAESIVNYASQKAGIGIMGGQVRGIGAKVKNGIVKHTGITPFYRYWQSALKSCSQGGMRGASATLYAPWWHYEIETIMVLKNNKGTEEDRVRKIDYAILRNKLLFERYQQNKDITLFSPEEVPDLQEAFYADQEKFKELYEKYEKDETIRRVVISAEEWFDQFHTERKETNRLYYANIDIINETGTFRPEVKPIKMSNLCVEITLPTVELGKSERRVVTIANHEVSAFVQHVIKSGGSIVDIHIPEEGDTDIEFDENLGRIQLCTLGAYNLGMLGLDNMDEMELPLETLVRILDELLDYQNYPEPEAYLAMKEHRPLGIGVCNLAYHLAKLNMKYGQKDTLAHWDKVMESFQYFLIKASVKLAEEKGQCERFSDSKYSQGIMPVDKYKKSVDELVVPVFHRDWDSLREQVVTIGMRHCTLSAQMPVESSALVLNATNGIEQPKDLVSLKDNSGAVIPQVVPEIKRLKNRYELLWDNKNCLEYIKMVAVQQKWFDQSISANTYFNAEKYEKNEVTMEDMILIDFLSYKWGVKTGYYCHTYDQAGDEVHDDATDSSENEPNVEINAEPCEGGACAI